jgi:hypothetical protein
VSLLTTLPFARCCCHHHRDDIGSESVDCRFPWCVVSSNSIQGLQRNSEELPSVTLRSFFFFEFSTPTANYQLQRPQQQQQPRQRLPVPSAEPLVLISLASPLSSSPAGHRLDTRHAPSVSTPVRPSSPSSVGLSVCPSPVVDYRVGF